MQDNDMKTNEHTTTEETSIGRRKLIKALGATGGVLAASTLSVRWEAPFIELSKLAADNTATSKSFDHDHGSISAQESKLTNAGGNEGQTRQLIAEKVVVALDENVNYVDSSLAVFRDGSTTWNDATSVDDSSLIVLRDFTNSKVGSMGFTIATYNEVIRPNDENEYIQLKTLNDGESLRVDVKDLAEPLDGKTVWWEIELVYFVKGHYHTVDSTRGAGTDHDDRGHYLELHRLVKVTTN